MKIAVITFHKSENFGSALQAYALNRFLKSKGHSVDIIDFILESDMMQYRLFRTPQYIRHPKYFIYDLLYYRRKKQRSDNFSAFRDKYMNLTENTYFYGRDDLSELNAEYDAFICGSDQIWNLGCTGGVIPEYFLGFVSGKKKIAYAPSMPGIYDKKFNSELYNLVSALDNVSVREKTAIAYLNGEIGVEKEIFHTVDPTLLISDEVYIKDFNLVKNTEKYIFVYILANAQIKSIVAEAKKLSEKTGLKIKYVFRRRITSLERHEYCFGIGPEQFLSLVFNAAYVITDSFHATVFSVQFSVPFRVFTSGNTSSRIIEFLDNTGMSDNYVSDNLDFSLPASDEDAKKRIKELAESSAVFLEDSLE